MQVWKDRLFPLLKHHLAEHVDSVTAYLMLYHEAALANLLEVRACLGLCVHARMRLGEQAVSRGEMTNSMQEE